LQKLRGKTHGMSIGVAAVKDGEVVWSHVCRVSLTMRNFSDDFLEHYLETVDPVVFNSVGVYQHEGLGAWLFEKVDGDGFSVSGFPMYALLGFLQDQGLVVTGSEISKRKKGHVQTQR